jgi:hypothetical protein
MHFPVGATISSERNKNKRTVDEQKVLFYPNALEKNLSLITN